MADITWASTQLPAAIRGIPYEAGLAITGAATAVTAGSVQSGALPAGLVVNASDHLRVTGTPTTNGVFTFTLSLTDTAGAVTSPSFTIVVRDAEPGDDLALGANRSAAHVARLRF